MAGARPMAPPTPLNAADIRSGGGCPTGERGCLAMWRAFGTPLDVRGVFRRTQSNEKVVKVMKKNWSQNSTILPNLSIKQLNMYGTDFFPPTSWEISFFLYHAPVYGL